MSDQAITSLIEKLEGAEVGSRELDREIMALSYRYEQRHIGASCWDDDDDTCCPGAKHLDWVWVDPATDHWKTNARDGFEFTTSLDAALALAERVLPGWHVGVQPWFHTDPDRVMSRAYLIRPDWKRWNPTGDEWCDQHHGRSCHTAELAVVSALLRAQSEAR